jgi:hypothetical protein
VPGPWFWAEVAVIACWDLATLGHLREIEVSWRGGLRSISELCGFEKVCVGT